MASSIYRQFSIHEFKFRELTANLAGEGLGDFKYLCREFTDQTQSRLLLRTGVYPYEYVNCEDKFLETSLPPKTMFYSQLTKSHISNDDYEYAKQVWEILNIKTLGEYHNIYLKTDVLLLADVFENCRTTCLKNYQLDAAHYFTSLGLAWSAALKMTNVQLQLLTEIDMYLFFENGIRGGMYMISNKYSKANNPYLPNDYDPSLPNKYIIYTD